jgi:hypothetical protein
LHQSTHSFTPLFSLCYTHVRRIHFESAFPRRIVHPGLCLSQLVFEGRPTGQAISVSVRPDLDEHPFSQLNAIPTVGFSDPILSYFSALKLNLGGGGILKEGYEKVIHLALNHIHLAL